MNARLLAPAALAAIFCGVLPARAADNRLLSLVMPDAKVVAGVNVDQARGTPFGQYVLSLMAPQDQEFQKMVTLLGFDPRRDVHELLAASTAVPAAHAGLLLALGNFDPSKVATAAASGGAKSQMYNGATILENPEQTAGVAFLSSTLVVMGDVASVKAAIDRQTAPSILPAALTTQISQLSASEDAWFVSIAPLSSLQPPAGAPQLPGLANANSFQAVQQASGGVKFGSMVVITGQAQTDTAQNATAMAGVVQFLANLAQAQAQQSAQAQSLLKSMSVNAQGNVVTLTMSLPTEQLQEMLKPHPASLQRQPRRPERKM